MNREPAIIDLGDYDEQGENLLPLNDWITLYRMKTGRSLNPGTMRKRRLIAGVGTLVPPRIYLLSQEEFETIMKTPLWDCQSVVHV